eukprot:scaffold253373_cov35-Tisochrysis_lutea.AAC.2
MATRGFRHSAPGESGDGQGLLSHQVCWHLEAAWRLRKGLYTYQWLHHRGWAGSSGHAAIYQERQDRAA